MHRPKFQIVSEAELRHVEGGGLFSWIRSAINKVESVVRSIGKPWT